MVADPLTKDMDRSELILVMTTGFLMIRFSSLANGATLDSGEGLPERKPCAEHYVAMAPKRQQQLDNDPELALGVH